MGYFKDREVAVVTGGNKGIGRGISSVLAEHGAQVAVSGIDAVAGKRTVEAIEAAGGKAMWVKCDVSQEAEVEELFEVVLRRFGRLDILVNNAGVGGYKRITDTSMADWERCMNVDLKGVFLGCKHAIPHMERHGKGAIVNISSVHSIKSVNGCAAYDTAKGGVSALSRQVAIDYGPKIRVNTVSPGWTMSELVQGIFDSYPDPLAQQRLVEGRQILKRIGTPEDVGRAVAFLASDDASFITGAELFVDGGLTCELERW